MAGSVNKVIILGNLGANPEVKYLPSGQAVCEMRIATTEVYKDRNEQRQERTEWHKVVVWGKTGENCGKFLAKGQQVYVEGRLQTRSWDDKDGNKRYMTEIVSDQVVFLRGGGGASPGAGPGEEGAPSRASPSYSGGGRSYGGGGAPAAGGAGYGGGAPARGAEGYGGGSAPMAEGGSPAPQPLRGRPPAAAPGPRDDVPPQEDFGGNDDDIPF